MIRPLCLLMCALAAAQAQPAGRPLIRLITLDPGHFHAALVQKFMYPDVDPVVHVYSPGGDDLTQHLKRIEQFNARTNDPTFWHEVVYTGPDFLQKMLNDRAGNVVVIAGNNARKVDNIVAATMAGLNVLADKPMAIVPEDLPNLESAFSAAAANGALIYDIMTERFEVTTELQRALSQDRDFFGDLPPGTPDAPAIVQESVHCFSKLVAGVPLRRPAWSFDVRQEGEGIVDVGTHLVDLVQWLAFPNQILSESDVNILTARRWATPISLAQFRSVTALPVFPDYLAGDVKAGALQCFCNGEFTYQLRGVTARVKVTWEFQPPPGGGDRHYAEMNGAKARLIIRQEAPQHFKATLYAAKAGAEDDAAFESRLNAAVAALQTDFPGVGCRRSGAEWEITVPDKYDVGHEAHFAQVTRNYLQYLRQGALPPWEAPGMLTKYATTLKAYALSHVK